MKAAAALRASAFRAPVLVLVLLAGCAARRGGLPAWVEAPPEDATYVYTVGARTGVPSLVAARRGALEEATGELARRFGVTASATYEEVRTQLATEVRDAVRSESRDVRIEGAVAEEWVLREAAGGYDAFVLLRYPRERAEREKARLAALDAAALHAAAQACRRADRARARGDAGEAISGYLRAAAGAGDSAAGVALRTDVLARLSALVGSLRFDVLDGDLQHVRPHAAVPAALRLRGWTGDAPAAGLPLRVEVPGGPSPVPDGTVRTDAAGHAEVRIERLREVPRGPLRVVPDVAALRPAGATLDDASEAVLRSLATRAATFHLLADRTRRPVRVALRIDERRDAGRPMRSLCGAALAERLERAGFRVVADEVSISPDRWADDARDVPPAGAVDVVVSGWCETRPGSDNRGWAISAQADAEVQAVDAGTGEVLVARSVIGRAGFGEREDRAEIDAVRAVAAELAEELAVALGVAVDDWFEPAEAVEDWSEPDDPTAAVGQAE